MNNQHERIIKYAEKHGTISPIEAFYELGITKLSTRIGEIEREGKALFERTRTKALNRYGEEVNFMTYKLTGKRSVENDSHI